VKRRKKKRVRRPVVSGSMPKISEMVWEFAGEFIRDGKTLEDKQNRLNAACSAWNIACNPPEVHNKSVTQYVEGYQMHNPEASDEELTGVRSTIEKLIQNKLRLFPTIHKQIVGAQISQAAGKDRIDVASLRIE